jgi:uncharacterized protein YunC (DUF1805 family)
VIRIWRGKRINTPKDGITSPNEKGLLIPEEWKKMLTIGSYQFRADTIPLRSGSLLLIQGSKGMLGCGYLSVDTAEKLGDALAVVTGVKSYEDMLKAKVKKVSSAAALMGVKEGMSGEEALIIMR